MIEANDQKGARMPDPHDTAGDRGANADEVSWRVIEPGTAVAAADGTPVGRVTHVLGDPDRDIFHGVGFRQHFWTTPRMAPAEAIARITERQVTLRLSATEAVQCPAYEEEEVYRIGNTGFFRRREGWRRDDLG
jgi:hypothetical protein